MARPTQGLQVRPFVRAAYMQRLDMVDLRSGPGDALIGACDAQRMHPQERGAARNPTGAPQPLRFPYRFCL